MNKERMKFWLTCPFCQRKFGVGPEMVLKYTDRLFNQINQEIEEEAKAKAKARPKPEPPANLPVGR
jgi:hypothetical protein